MPYLKSFKRQVHHAGAMIAKLKIVKRPSGKPPDFPGAVFLCDLCG
jgi:hypothetical protein